MANDCEQARQLLLAQIQVFTHRSYVAYNAAQEALTKANELQAQATQVRRCRQVLADLKKGNYDQPIAALDSAIVRLSTESANHTADYQRLNTVAANHAKQLIQFQDAADALSGVTPTPAQVHVVPGSLLPGGTFTLNGSKFQAGTIVTCDFCVGPTPGVGVPEQVVDTVVRTADRGGQFTGTYTVKSGQASGTYHWRFTAPAHQVPSMDVTVR